MFELVSIIIPAYNAEKWISQSIKSALLQTWKNKEIIIVDDGSRDRTLEIAKKYESSCLKVVSQDNRGASSARNKGLSYAQGSYIQWLDADDLLAPDKISTQMNLAQYDSTELTLYSSPHGKFYWRPEKARFYPNSLWQDLSPFEWMFKKLSENPWMIPAVWLVSRKLTDRAGPWNEQLTLNDDGEYFFRVVAVSKEVQFVPFAKSYYRQWNINQLSRSASDKALQSLFLSQRLCAKRLLSLEDSEEARMASVKCLLRLYRYLYPEYGKILKDVESFIIELNGQPELPKFGWKMTALHKIFGWKVAKRIKTASDTLRLSVAVKWDEVLYKMFSDYP